MDELDALLFKNWFELGPSRFACAKCWGMRFDSVASCPNEAWIRFVSVISGGLLYGHEVLPPRELMRALYDLAAGRAHAGVPGGRVRGEWIAFSRDFVSSCYN